MPAFAGWSVTVVPEEVEVDPVVGLVKVAGARDRPGLQGLDHHDGAERPGAAEEVPGEGFGRRDGNLVPEYGLDGFRFQAVTHGGGRRVGVDQADVPGAKSGRRDRLFHHPALHGGISSDDVDGVGRHRGPGHDAEDVGPAGPGVVLTFQDQDRGALGHHESVPVPVEGPRRGLRVPVAGGQGPDLREPADDQAVDAGIHAAGDHHVRRARPDHVGRLGDGFRPGGAGAHRGPRPALGADVDGHPGRRRVDHDPGEGMRGYPARAAGIQRPGLLEGGVQAAVAGTDHHGQPLRVSLGTAGLRPRFPGGDQRQMPAAVHPLVFGGGELRGDVDVHPAGHADGEALRPVLLQRRDSGTPGQQRGPGLGRGPAHRGHGTQSGDNDSGRSFRHGYRYFCEALRATRGNAGSAGVRGVGGGREACGRACGGRAGRDGLRAGGRRGAAAMHPLRVRAILRPGRLGVATVNPLRKRTPAPRIRAAAVQNRSGKRL